MKRGLVYILFTAGLIGCSSASAPFYPDNPEMSTPAPLPSSTTESVSTPVALCTNNATGYECNSNGGSTLKIDTTNDNYRLKNGNLFKINNQDYIFSPGKLIVSLKTGVSIEMFSKEFSLSVAQDLDPNNATSKGAAHPYLFSTPSKLNISLAEFPNLIQHKEENGEYIFYSNEDAEEFLLSLKINEDNDEVESAELDKQLLAPGPIASPILRQPNSN